MRCHTLHWFLCNKLTNLFWISKKFSNNCDTEKGFHRSFLYLQCCRLSTDPVQPGGGDIAVNWSNRLEFASLVEMYRLSEFQLQSEAISRGISMIIPSHFLCLFSWQELEYRVCGRPGIDLDVLQVSLFLESTIYNESLFDLLCIFWIYLDLVGAKKRKNH